MQRLSQLWAPRARRWVLLGGRRAPEPDDGEEEAVVELATAPQVALQMLREDRGPIFEAAAGSEGAVEAWLAKHERNWPAMDGLARQAGLWSFGGRARNNTPGPAGLRYFVWAGAGEVACKALGQLPSACLRGNRPRRILPRLL